MKKRILIIAFAMLYATGFAFAEESVKFTLSGGIVSENLRTAMQNNLNNLFAHFTETIMSPGSKLKLPSKGITKDGRETIMEMWESSQFSCDIDEVREKLIKTSMGYEVRNIPVTMYEADEEHRDQMLVVDFNPTNGDIENVSIAVDGMLYNRILGNNEDVELTRRQVIVNFIENFRTAYNRRDIGFLNQVYSDNALIITGHVIKEMKKSSGDSQRAIIGNNVEYVRQSKAEYISRLSKIFKTVKYLDVDFSNIDVHRHPKNNTLYGVTLRQKWTTNNYSDDGYLFLAIDFYNELTPSIQVRTWQPAWVGDRELGKDEVFGFHNLKFN